MVDGRGTRLQNLPVNGEYNTYSLEKEHERGVCLMKTGTVSVLVSCSVPSTESDIWWVLTNIY